MTPTRLRGEQGTSLLLALAFITLLGVFATAILSANYADFKTTQVVRGRTDALYGADGGADVAVQLLRASSKYCPNVSGTPTNLPNQAIDGRTVRITCQTLSGSTGNPGGLSTYSIVLTGYNNPNGTTPNKDLLFRTAGDTLATPVQVGGPVFVGGGFEFDAAIPKMQINGNLDQYDDTPTQYCTADKALAATTGNPWSGNPVVTGAWTCRLAASFPVPDPVPTLIVPTAARPNPVVQDTCTILFPGKYTNASSLPTFDIAKKYYFASGVYYFENTGQIHLKGEVFGGQPGPTETQLVTTATPCSNDAAANGLVAGSATGSGVEFVLGGTAKLKTETHANVKIELFARAPAVPANEGTAGVSVYAPRTAGANYLAWNSDQVFHMDGNKSQMVIHGLLYAPNGNIDGIYTLANPGNAPLFLGGVVAQRLTIHFDNQTQTRWSVSTSAGTPPTPRTVVVTATADPLVAGEAPTVINAVVQLGTAAGTPATVLSWRKV